MSYFRVIPRDLFNESKLLKCIGRLCLLIHDNKAPEELSFEETEEGDRFKIELIESGELFVSNLRFYVKGAINNDGIVTFKTAYNSKEPYPLFMEYCFDETKVFDDEGEFTEEFLNEIKNISNNED